jgi:NAD-dependent deacetylase
LWANYNPEELATPEGFLRNPELVWRWYAQRRDLIAACAPNAGHRALAELETFYDDYLLITQNIDNLHRAAGSSDPVEVHGNIFRYKCFDNHHAAQSLPEGDEIPPRCHCGSMMRPDVVWFGELLPADHLERAYAALAQCDAVLVVGTSGQTYPAAGFPGIARQAGARVVEVNPERSTISGFADVFVGAGAAVALPPIVERTRTLRE